MANFLMGIISLSIGAVVLSGVFITTIKATNQTYRCYNYSGDGREVAGGCAWGTSEIALYGLLTICGIAGMVYGVLNVFGIA